MARKYSDEERERILSESYELLRRDDAETQSHEPELSRDEILHEALSRPIEDGLTEWRRKAAEREQRIAAQRADRETTMAQAMASHAARLEEKLAGMRAEQREHVFSVIEDALAVFDEEVTGPLAGQVAALSEKVATLDAELKKLRRLDSDPIDVPALELLPRRMQ